MKLLILALTLPALLSCTLYQSEGREALEKNKNNIVGATGFNPSKSLQYTCGSSAQAPEELQGPAEVLESDYESQGFAAYLISEKSHQNHVLVYELRGQNNAEIHQFCRIFLLQPVSDALITEAIDLGVFHLLDPNARP